MTITNSLPNSLQIDLNSFPLSNEKPNKNDKSAEGDVVIKSDSGDIIISTCESDEENTLFITCESDDFVECYDLFLNYWQKLVESIYLISLREAEDLGPKQAHMTKAVEKARNLDPFAKFIFRQVMDHYDEKKVSHSTLSIKQVKEKLTTFPVESFVKAINNLGFIHAYSDIEKETMHILYDVNKENIFEKFDIFDDQPDSKAIIRLSNNTEVKSSGQKVSIQLIDKSKQYNKVFKAEKNILTQFPYFHNKISKLKDSKNTVLLCNNLSRTNHTILGIFLYAMHNDYSIFKGASEEDLIIYFDLLTSIKARQVGNQFRSKLMSEEFVHKHVIDLQKQIINELLNKDNVTPIKTIIQRYHEAKSKSDRNKISYYINLLKERCYIGNAKELMDFAESENLHELMCTCQYHLDMTNKRITQLVEDADKGDTIAKLLFIHEYSKVGDYEKTITLLKPLCAEENLLACKWFIYLLKYYRQDLMHKYVNDQLKTEKMTQKRSDHPESLRKEFEKLLHPDQTNSPYIEECYETFKQLRYPKRLLEELTPPKTIEQPSGKSLRLYTPEVVGQLAPPLNFLDRYHQNDFRTITNDPYATDRVRESMDKNLKLAKEQKETQKPIEQKYRSNKKKNTQLRSRLDTVIEEFTHMPYHSFTVATKGDRDYMEDTHVAETVMLQWSPEEPPLPISIYAVMDGHGGDYCAKFVAENLVDHVARRLVYHSSGNSKDLTDVTIFDALKMACLDLDVAFNLACGDLGLYDAAGSTMVMALMIQGKTYITNIGDSRAVISHDRTGIEETIQLTEDAKPNLKRYQRGVEKRDGKVRFNRVNGMLSTARAFGNTGKLGKSKDGDSTYYAVTCRPKISDWTECNDGNILILASDGLWDIFTSDQAMNLVRERLRSGDSLKEASMQLVKKVYDKKPYDKDNITVTVINLPKK